MTRIHRWILIGLLSAACGGKKPPSSPVPAAPSPVTSDTTGDLAVAAVAPQLTFEERLSKAAALLTTGRAEHAREALIDLKQLAQERANVAEVPYNMGVAYQQIDDINNARRYLLRATQVDPTLGNAWLNLGALAERDGQYARALQHYRAGLRHDPEHSQLVVGVIGILRRQGRHDQAIAEAKSALARNANNINAYNNLGLVYVDQGKLDLALFIYQKALNSIDGADNNAHIHCNLGRVWLAKEKTANAREQLERALELDPDMVAAMLFLAQMYLDNHDYETTAKLLERAQELQPENAAIYINLGIAYRGMRQFDRAEENYNKSLRLDSGNLDPYLNRAVLLGDHMGRFDEAIGALETYRSRGGSEIALADSWASDITEKKERYQRDLERSKKREDAQKKREEQERLANEYQRMEEKWAVDEAARKAAEEAAQSTGASTPPPAGAGDAQPTTTVVAPSDSDAGGSSSPTDVWGTGSEVPSGSGTDPAAPTGAAPAGTTVVIVPPAPTSEPRGTRNVGAPCTDTQQCVDGLTCSAGGSCEADITGTRSIGAPCTSDGQCVEGLLCGPRGTCARVVGVDSDPWGGTP